MGRMKLRSNEWFERQDEVGIRHRSILVTLGMDPQYVTGKPVIGICNPTSEFNNCEMGLKEFIEPIKRGVAQAGGLALQFPTMGLGAELLKPSDLPYRNLVAMDIEETVRGNPIDGLVLLTGCDKTTPAQLMAAASCDIPAIQLCAGPKASGFWRGQEVSAATDLWKYWDDFRSAKIQQADLRELEQCISCSYGTCNEMGTASTMAAVSEALGMMPSGTSTIPANHSRRRVAAEATGRRIVEMVNEDLRPSRIMTTDAFHNAIRVLSAIGGSTNAVIHLVAIAGRLGIQLPLSLFDEISQVTPMIVNLKPSGRFLMEHLHRAGGLPAVMHEIAELLAPGLPDGFREDSTGTHQSRSMLRPQRHWVFAQAILSIRRIGGLEGKPCSFGCDSQGVRRQRKIDEPYGPCRCLRQLSGHVGQNRL